MVLRARRTHEIPHRGDRKELGDIDPRMGPAAMNTQNPGPPKRHPGQASVLDPGFDGAAIPSRGSRPS